MQLPGSGIKVNIYKETLMSSHLKVCVGAVASNIKAFASHGGNTSYCELKASNREHGKLRFNTDYAHGAMQLGTNTSNFFRLTNWNNEINFINRQQELQMTDLRKTKKLQKLLVKHYPN